MSELTCIMCPMGCRISIEADSDGNILNISGNGCDRGKAYAKDEITDPRRMLTTTIACKNGKVLPVKTKNAIPKSEIFKIMHEINGILLENDVNAGDIVLKNAGGTDIPIIATKSTKKC